MADVVTSTIYENGPRRLVMGFTSVSDGTGETGVKKVDAQSASFAVTVQGQAFLPGVHLKVVDVWYDIASMKLRLRWDANAPTDFLVIGGFGHWSLLDRRAGFQGFVNPNAAGATGSILFTTVGANLNATYSVVLEMIKGVPQT